MCLNAAKTSYDKIKYLEKVSFPLVAYKIMANRDDETLTGMYAETGECIFKPGINKDINRGKTLRCSDIAGQRYSMGFHCFLHKSSAKEKMSNNKKILSKWHYSTLVLKKIIIEKPEHIEEIGVEILRYGLTMPPTGTVLVVNQFELPTRG